MTWTSSVMFCTGVCVGCNCFSPEKKGVELQCTPPNQATVWIKKLPEYWSGHTSGVVLYSLKLLGLPHFRGSN